MNPNPELLKKIIEVVDQHIRPSLDMDGGDVEIISLIGNTLSVKFKGACSGCIRAGETLKYGIQRTINQLVSKDIVVVSV
ncbi:MAG: NifU family protein [Holosporaceae bacterium]|jgi:NifU-like protein|nr:NifU family protein [Holosporaceae bacterium]